MFARNQHGERRVSASLYRRLLAAHVIVSVGWLGAAFAKLVLLMAVMTSGPDIAAAAYVAATKVVNVVFPPLAIGTVVTGLLLSVGTKWRLLDHYWVATKLVLSVGVITTAVQLGSRLEQRPISASVGPGAADSVIGIASAPMTLLIALTVAHLLMLGAATVISVYKPWGRTWFGRRKAAQPRHRLGGAQQEA